MIIQIDKNNEKKLIDVNIWSIIKAVFIGNLIINIIALGVFFILLLIIGSIGS